jgi:phosphoserine phosphatase RsbU/P
MDDGLVPSVEALYDNAPCGLLVARGSGQIVRINGTLCRWLGYEKRELIEVKRLQDLLNMGGRIFHQTHLAPLLRMQGSVAEVKLELRHKDGHMLPMMVNVAERQRGGELLQEAAFFIAEDRHRYERELLLQRKRAEELAERHAQAQKELAQAQTRLEDRALFAEQMVGIVSHDLRNPLSAIRMATMVLERGDLSAQQRTVLGRINNSTGRAQRLIEDLLDFTQARLGRGLRMNPLPIDLHAVVSENVAELATSFPERQIRHVAQGSGGCNADADRIAQLLGNLVGNAASYGTPGEPITVTSELDGDSCTVRVHNHGDPIEPTLLPVLFEPMIRGVDSSRGGGVGLGLYIVAQIARAHGGRVDATSNAAEGTTFTVWFPANAAAPKEPASPDATISPG